VRELKNVIERAVILSRGEVLRLDLSLSEAARSDAPVAPPPAVSASPTVLTDAQMREQQRLNVLAALQAANWRISGPGGAADILGLKPTTLADRMRALGLERPPRKAAGRARRASSP
jgi:transcriptional regulator with GAF, ATPase, and Fis domain